MNHLSHKLVFPARYGFIGHYVRKIFLRLPDEVRSRAVRAALAEALGNAIIHGALGLGSRDDADSLEAFLRRMRDAEAARGDRAVTVTIRGLAPNAVAVEIQDPGPGFDWQATARRPGRGLGILFQTVAAVGWNSRGNIIRLCLERNRKRSI